MRLTTQDMNNGPWVLLILLLWILFINWAVEDSKKKFPTDHSTPSYEAPALR